MLSRRRNMACWLLACMLLIAQRASAAPNEALDNILVSKSNGVATLQIWPACQMRYLSHSPLEAGTEVRIKITTGPDCTDLLSEVSSEMYQPAGRRMGKVNKIIFDAVGGQGHFITLYFDEPQKYEVRQHPTGWIEVFVDTNIASATLPPDKPEPLRIETKPLAPAAALVVREPASSPTPPPPRPVRRQVAPSTDGDFVVQLGVFGSVDAAVTELLRTNTEHFAYTTEFSVNGKTWHGLQLGFFDSESSADIVLHDLRVSFPDSWVRYVDPGEAERARASGELRAITVDQVPAVRVSRTVPEEDIELASLMADGRAALIARQYTLAINKYTRVLEYPDHAYRADARENLGVAFERNGQTANSVAEYQALLTEFPDAEGAARVGSRLTSLQTAVPPVRTSRPTSINNDSGGWDVFGGISQYYWRNQEQLVHDGNDIVSSSGVLALGDVTTTRRGERFDILARFNGAYQFNLVEFDDRGDIGWVSDAFISVTDQRLDLEGRVGRQTRRQDGVLGRFDGAAASYQWKQDISFSASAGFPMDSPRYISGSNRAFYAAGAHVDDIWDTVSITAYTHQQTVDGISDRQAIGSNLQYRNGPLNVVGLIDYDASYGVLNTALVNANWALSNDWRIYGMFDFGAQPYLTTRNALTGQTATSITELLETYSEGQIRTLARDRTAQAHTASLGVAIPFWDRFKLSLDITTRQSEATVASGGVAALPATGTQMYYNATLMSTDLLRQGDLTMFTTRYDSTRTRDSLMLLFDTRLPFGEGLRVNPRLMLRQITHKPDNTEQMVVSPSLRVLYRWKKMMLDLETGGHWSSRDVPINEFNPFAPEGTEELLGGFVRLGYRLEF